MFFHKNLEQKIQDSEQKIKEFAQEIQQQEEELEKLISEIGMSPKEVDELLSNKENFGDEVWEELQKEKVLLEEKLQKDLDNIQDPLKSKKALSELRLRQNWLFIK